MSATKKRLLAASLLTCAGAFAQWPPDARMTSQKIDANTVTKSVVVLRKCEEIDRITEFTFDYPQLRRKSAAAQAVNRAIVESFDVPRELAECWTPVPGPAPEGADSVWYHCQISSRHRSLLSLECRRGYYDRHAGSGGYTYFLNFDLTDGRQIEFRDLIAPTADFKKKVRAKLLAEYQDVVKDASEEFLDELTQQLPRSCGFTHDSLVCTALVGTHGNYDIGFPIADLCKDLPAAYFARPCEERSWQK